MTKYLLAIAALLFAGSAIANDDYISFLSYTYPTNTSLELTLFNEPDPDFNPCDELVPNSMPAIQFYESYSPKNMVQAGCWVRKGSTYEVTWFQQVNEADFDAGIRTGIPETIQPYTETIETSAFIFKRCDLGMTNCRIDK